MKKATEYRVHADDCRAMAGKSSNDEQRAALLQMAENWENLARGRQRLLHERQMLEEIPDSTSR